MPQRDSAALTIWCSTKSRPPLPQYLILPPSPRQTTTNSQPPRLLQHWLKGEKKKLVSRRWWFFSLRIHARVHSSEREREEDTKNFEFYLEMSIFFSCENFTIRITRRYFSCTGTRCVGSTLIFVTRLILLQTRTTGNYGGLGLTPLERKTK